MSELTFACIAIGAALGMGALAWWLVKHGPFRNRFYYAYSRDRKTKVRMTKMGSIFSVIIQYPDGVWQHRVIHVLEIYNLICELNLEDVFYEDDK